MFYEKLAEKRVTRKEQTDAVTGGMLGLLAAQGSAKASQGLQRKAWESLDATLKRDESDVRSVLRGMGASMSGDGDEYVLRAKDGRTIKVELGPLSRTTAYHDGAPRMFGIPGEAPTITLGGKALNRDTFFHELGHATGAGARPLPSRLRLGAVSARDMLAPGNRLAGQLAAGYAGAAANKRQADNANSAANAALLASGLLELPELAEEARASIRANALAKKFTGKGINKATLLRAYGTYAAQALGNTAPALVAKGIAKYKQRKYRDEKTASRTQEEPQRDPALRMIRMYGGGALGATLGGGAAAAAIPAGAASLGRYGELQVPERYNNAAYALAGLGAALGAYGGHRYHKAQQRKKRREER